MLLSLVKVLDVAVQVERVLRLQYLVWSATVL